MSDNIVDDIVEGMNVGDAAPQPIEILEYVQRVRPDVWEEATHALVIARQKRIIEELREQADNQEKDTQEVDEDGSQD
jgi:hypothetical protein